MTHYDKPKHQQWLYRLADIGMVKAIMLIWLVCLLTVIGSLLLVKVVVAYFK